RVDRVGVTARSHTRPTAWKSVRTGKLDVPSMKSPSRKFGTFEVDLRARELRKGGIRIRLQDQPFEILAMMLDRPGDVGTREDLSQRLWPAGTFVDFERSLNAAVKRLRAALGDEADNPRFVETLHKRGYRFIAPIESDFAPAGATSDKSRENGGRRTTSVVPLTIGKAPREAG